MDVCSVHKQYATVTQVFWTSPETILKSNLWHLFVGVGRRVASDFRGSPVGYFSFMNIHRTVQIQPRMIRYDPRASVCRKRKLIMPTLKTIVILSDKINILQSVRVSEFNKIKQNDVQSFPFQSCSLKYGKIVRNLKFIKN